MKLVHIIKTSYRGLTAHKARSFLTVLGVVIGITAIMLVYSLGKGAENLILGEIGSLGAETVVVLPGKQPTGPTDSIDTLFADSLKQRSLDALQNKANVPNLVEIMPAVFVSGSASYDGSNYRPVTMGASAEFMANTFGVFPEEGVLFDDFDISSRASVAVIGSKVKQELFGESDAVGEFMQLRDRKFRVVGVFPQKGQVSFFNIDELVIIPYTTAQTYLLGTNHFNRFIIKADHPDNVLKMAHDIEVTLMTAHSIDNPDDKDFFIETQQGLMDQIKVIIGALTIMLSLIVAISLVVAGVGLMNVVLVSVAERTKEIGLRKALGATDRDILLQFLFEAIILTVIGGVIGIFLGSALAYLISVAITQFGGLSWQFVFPLGAAFLGVFVSILVGVIFGVYPARLASKKSPMEALRYE